jgi:hypothetical protein
VAEFLVLCVFIGVFCGALALAGFIAELFSKKEARRG